MPIEVGRTAAGDLLWIANPFTGVVTYLTDIHLKNNGFASVATRQPHPAAGGASLDALRAACAFCPGNEALTTEEVLRHPAGAGPDWEIRAFYNLFPRIPVECTGGRNESYVVVESPDHFRADAAHPDDLVYSAMLSADRFRAVVRATAEVARTSYANPAVTSVAVRKNQGRESGASQPHTHTQVIGSGQPLPPLRRELEVMRAEPAVFHQLVELAHLERFMIAERDGCYLYFSPVGAFPRCYEVVDLATECRLDEVEPARLDLFADLVHQGLSILGDSPLDYEIHAQRGVPLHAHIHSRHYPYSNIAGTLNLPTGLLRGRAND